MLGKIVFVDLNKFLLDLRDSCRILMLHPGGNTLGHSANDEIVVIRFHQTIVEDLFNRLILGYALVVGIQRFIGSIQKLVKG